MSAVSTPPSEPPENGADRRASLAAVVMVVALLVAGELFACPARSFQKVPSVIPGRMANVVGFADKLVLVPPSPKPARPALLLLGSSQSYASSSPEPNANGLGDQAGTLIDRLAEEVALPQATYLRFASGSILPNEMMIAEAYVEAMGYRPAVVVLPRRPRKAWLLVTSLVFYASWHVKYVVLLASVGAIAAATFGGCTGVVELLVSCGR